MAEPSALEQYLLELINAERAAAGVQPLAFDGDLNEAAENHSVWMINTDTFSHTGAGGSDAGQRMQSAGYVFSGSWTWGENIAWASTRSPAGYKDEVELLHTNLMNSSGHRANILSNSFREIGLGYEIGEYQGFEGAFVTEDFARSGSSIFLTGVAFDDQDGDLFYDPGEGLGSITVTAVGSGGATFTTTTMAAGGYDLALPAGSYTVTFSGAGIATTSRQVTISSVNVKVDLVDPASGGGGGTSPPPPPAAITGTAVGDVLNGTSGGDTIRGLDGNDVLYGHAGNDSLEGGNGDDTLDPGTGSDTLAGGAGNDTYVYRAGYTPFSVTDNSGYDTLLTELDNTTMGFLAGTSVVILRTGAAVVTASGNSAGNLIYGNGNANVLYGETGGDMLFGGEGGDLIFGFKLWRNAGEADASGDILYGEGGSDVLMGDGGNDWLYGGTGDDWIEGDDGNRGFTITPGNDLIYGEWGNDTILAGAGNDTAYGGDDVDFVIGEGGADLMFGEGATDYMDGRDGADTLYGGESGDVLFGDGLHNGNASLVGADVLYGGAGNDTMMGEDGTLGTNGGNDTLLGEDGDDQLAGGGGNDWLFGQNGNDIIDGHHGSDTVVGGAGADIIAGSAFNGGTTGGDTIVYQFLSDGGDLIFGFDTNAATGLDLLDLRLLFDNLGYAGTTPRQQGLLYVFQNAADTVVYVDADGAGGAFGLTQMATLYGVNAAQVTDASFLFQ